MKRLPRFYFLLLLSIIAVASLTVFSHVHASAPDWFQNSTPTVTPGKADIGYEQTYPVNCRDQLLYNGDLINPSFTPACTVDTTVGTLNLNSEIIIDNRDTYRLRDKTGSFSHLILPVPNNGGYIQTNYASPWGAFIYKYESLSRGDLLKKTYSGVPPRTQYDIQKNPDRTLTDGSGTPIRANGSPLAFSANGEWMIVDIPNQGLFRVNAAMNEMTPFAKAVEQTTVNRPLYFAISDDGNLVATAGPTSLTMYNLGSCTQHNFVYGSPVSTAGCVARELWNDQGNTSGIRAQVAGGEVGGHLEFVDSGTLKLVGRQRDADDLPFIYSEYYISAPGAAVHKLAFLGMGDSYISGEGIGTYQPGTDTGDNKCHLSPESYPYLIGSQFFDSYVSIACSGAKTADVDGNNRLYTGQTKAKIALKERVIPSEAAILAAFNPGYAQQRMFVEKYHPATALISIGGNDVEFANIVKSCVVPHPSVNTCYGTYEARKQKAQQIHDSFSDLVDTYKNILKNGTQNLYVVGYPEVAAENGDCGDNVHLNSDEIKFSNLLIHYLNQTIEAAAQVAGARYVDIEHALDGHRLCEASGSDIAMNGFTAGNDTLLFIGNESYHPTALGHRLIGQTILAATNNMQQPMPAADNNALPPPITDDMPLLVGLAPESNLPKLESVDDLTNGTLIRGSTASIYVDGLNANTAPKATYKVVLHSSPVTLGTIVSDSDGNISGTITIPDDIPPGIHTINLYGLSYGGKQIQIQQFVYIAASSADIDGNGVPNSLQQCVITPTIGHDVDGDGMDDACDAQIGEATSSSTEHPEDESTTAVTDSENAPIVAIHTANPGSVQPTDSTESSAGTTPKSSGEHVQGATTAAKETKNTLIAEVATKPLKNSYTKALLAAVAILGVGLTIWKIARVHAHPH